MSVEINTVKLIRSYVLKYPTLAPYAVREKILEETGLEVSRKTISGYRRRLKLPTLNSVGRPLNTELPEPKYFGAEDIPDGSDGYKDGNPEKETGGCDPSQICLASVIQAIKVLRQAWDLLGSKEEVKRLLEVL